MKTTNPALPGFLASRSLYFSDYVENQACLLLPACLQAVSETEALGHFPEFLPKNDTAVHKLQSVGFVLLRHEEAFNFKSVETLLVHLVSSDNISVSGSFCLPPVWLLPAVNPLWQQWPAAAFRFFVLPAVNPWRWLPSRSTQSLLVIGPPPPSCPPGCIAFEGERVNVRLGRLSWAGPLPSYIKISLFPHHPAMPNPGQSFVLGIPAS